MTDTDNRRHAAEHGRQNREVLGLDIREVELSDSGRYLEGIAVPYNTWADIGWFMEAHAPGSFAKSIREAARGLPLLMFHDSKSLPVGVSHEWRDTTDHLGCVWRIDTKDDLAVEAARKAADGILTGLSIGFAPIKTTWETDEKGLDWATRTESRLLEVSLTPTPAFAGAAVTMVRSREVIVGEQQRRSSELDAYRRELDAMRAQQNVFEGGRS